MFGSDSLDVAIGIAFVYLMVSFVCSAAVEFLEVLLKNRPKKLLTGIKELLQSDGWVNKIYNDPMVSSLFKGKFGDVKPRNLPSYIPARNFAVAVLNQLDDSASWDGLNASVEKLFPQAARDTLQTLRGKQQLTPAESVEKKALEAQEHIYKALKGAMLTAEGDLNKAVKNIQDWYDSAMDRVSGWFKRRTHIILLCLGAVAAVAYNIDSLSIVMRLSNDKTVRQAVVASAGTAVAQPRPSAAGTGAGADQTPKEAEDHLLKSITTMQEQTKGLIGWGERPVFYSELIGPSIRMHGLGWLLTAIAVSFGAPFWFDVLNKFMVVRSTVKPKEKSGNEKSKDAK
jgi:hypothetical protein